MKTNWCLKCNEAAKNCLCGAQALLQTVEVAMPLTRRVEKRIAFLREKLEGVQRALREEPKDDRPTHDRVGSIGIEIAGSKEPFESRSWVISWRKDEASLTAQIADFNTIRAIVEAHEFPLAKPDLSKCVKHLQARDRSDWGSPRTCGAEAFKNGLCRKHHPETKPKRDARGRIVKTEVR